MLKKIKALTEAQYQALSVDEKERLDTIYMTPDTIHSTTSDGIDMKLYSILPLVLDTNGLPVEDEDGNYVLDANASLDIADEVQKWVDVGENYFPVLGDILRIWYRVGYYYNESTEDREATDNSGGTCTIFEVRKDPINYPNAIRVSVLLHDEDTWESDYGMFIFEDNFFYWEAYTSMGMTIQNVIYKVERLIK